MSVAPFFVPLRVSANSVHFLWRRENEPKETFPQPRPSPEGRMQKENCRNRQFSLGFGIAGHAIYCF